MSAYKLYILTMKRHLLFVIALAGSLTTFAQKDPAVLDINGKPVSKSEFLQIYLKNNPSPQYDKQSLDDYVSLFTKFKLKVTEAEALGYDTIPKLKRELEGYRKTLSTPYLVDHEKNDALVKEAYERMKSEIRASHILIKVAENASPADTLKAYNKIMALKKRIEAGEDFNGVASGPGGSEDPSVAYNHGDLGFFTAFQMVFPFEDAAFKTPVGSVSNPIRSRFGYHIIKVTDQRPARGSIKTAHIMVATGKEATPEDIEAARKKADEIYAKLKAGENFEQLAQDFSDDVGTAERGGVLPVFGSGASTRMIPVFEDAAFALKNDGDISQPVQSDFGFHIIKRLEWSDIGSFESMKKDLQNRVNRDERSKVTQDSFIAKLKKQYKYKDLSGKNLKWFEKSIDSSYVRGTWAASSLKTNKPLFTMDGKSFTQKEFADYLSKNQRTLKTAPLSSLVKTQYAKWEKATILDYEESKLEGKYPEFRALMQEYHDGILLYEVMTDKVWNKAVKDSVGLENFYNAHKQNYLWKERMDGFIYECLNKTVADEVYKMLQDPKNTSKEIIEKVNKDSELNLRVRTNKFEIESTPSLNNKNLVKGVNKPYEFEGKYYVVKVDELLPSGTKELSEAKGIITSDYQTQLEKDWLDELSKKYPVKVHYDVLYHINK